MFKVIVTLELDSLLRAPLVVLVVEVLTISLLLHKQITNIYYLFVAPNPLDGYYYLVRWTPSAWALIVDALIRVLNPIFSVLLIIVALILPAQNNNFSWRNWCAGAGRSYSIVLQVLILQSAGIASLLWLVSAVLVGPVILLIDLDSHIGGRTLP